MRNNKTTVVAVCAIIFSLAIGSSSLMANPNWAGTGTGFWYYNETFSGYPFHNWIGQLTESTGLNGRFLNDRGDSIGYFCSTSWFGNTYNGIWGLMHYQGDGCWTITLDPYNDTCWGDWDSCLDGTGSGYIYGWGISGE